MKKVLYLLFCFVSLPIVGTNNLERFASGALVFAWNGKLMFEGNTNRFSRQEDGSIVFSGFSSPSWAIESFLDFTGVEKGHGTAGIDPFKNYNYAQWKKSLLYQYLDYKGSTYRWEGMSRGKPAVGSQIIIAAKNRLGPTLFKDAKNYSEIIIASRNSRNRLGPTLFKDEENYKNRDGVIIMSIVFWFCVVFAILKFAYSRGQQGAKEELMKYKLKTMERELKEKKEGGYVRNR